MSKVLPTPHYTDHFRKLAAAAGGVNRLAQVLGVSRDPVNAVIKGTALNAATWLVMSSRLAEAEKVIRREASGHGDPNSATARKLRAMLADANRRLAALEREQTIEKARRTLAAAQRSAKPAPAAPPATGETPSKLAAEVDKALRIPAKATGAAEYRLDPVTGQHVMREPGVAQARQLAARAAASAKPEPTGYQRDPKTGVQYMKTTTPTKARGGRAFGGDQ